MALKLGSLVSNPASILGDSPAHKFPSSRNGNWFPPPSLSQGISDQAKLFITVSTKCTFAGVVLCPHMNQINTAICSRKLSHGSNTSSTFLKVPRSSGSSSSEGSPEEPSDQENVILSYDLHVPFGYTRKDVLLIGLGVTVLGVGLKYGLEAIVQLVLVLGLTVGWISTYLYRVSNKEMTYAQQLRDYENKVMQKRLQGLTEAELEALLEQVEEEKRCMASGEHL